MTSTSRATMPSRLLPLVAALLLSACTASPDPDKARDAAMVEFGQRLFFDRSLSADGQISCASCHDPDRAFTDGRPVSIGVNGHKGTRNASSLIALDVYSSHFWDGRETRLKDVVLQPFTNPVEMGMASLDVVLARVGADPAYASSLATLGLDGSDQLDAGMLAEALRSYVDTLEHARSRYDRHRVSGSGEDRLDSSELAGLTLFTGKAECSQCHTLDDSDTRLTDNRFHHTGVGFEAISGRIPELIARLGTVSEDATPLGHRVLQDADIAAAGRFAQSRKPVDLAAFRTPSLRDVALTAPYMHDGSIATLAAAVDHELYYRGLSRGEPIALTAQEKADLLAFLHALTGDYGSQDDDAIRPEAGDAADDPA